MKKFFLSFALLLGALGAFAQSFSAADIQEERADYSNFYYCSRFQTWHLYAVASDAQYTALFFSIVVNNNEEGWFNFSRNITISGPWGSLHPVGLTINDNVHELDEAYYYDKRNKGNEAKVALYFPRIPAGVSEIDYCETNFIYWAKVPVPGNPDPCELSSWNEARLRDYWKTHEAVYIEGIYYFIDTSDKDWWGPVKHTLAVKKDGYEYKLIYLKGSNPAIWTEGEVKASFVPTATKGLYKVTDWYMENKIANEDFYLQFDEGMMSVYENTSNISADFIKLFPSVDENEIIAAAAASKHTCTGSGVFVAGNIIATNYHVIEDAKQIEIVVKDGQSVRMFEASPLTVDKTNDLALLQIDGQLFAGIGNIPFAITSRTKDVGTSVFTMGYPMANYLGHEVKITDGIINSKTGYEGDIVTYQISAPIHPGSSGGPLFDRAGNLVGITNAGIQSAQNVGYAIKSSYLCNLIDSAPINISIPESSRISNMDLPEQIKCLSKYVVFIMVN